MDKTIQDIENTIKDMKLGVCIHCNGAVFEDDRSFLKLVASHESVCGYCLTSKNK